MVSRASIGISLGCLGLVTLACVALGVRVGYRPAQGSSPFGALTAAALHGVTARDGSETPVKLPQVLRLAERPVDTAATPESLPAPGPETTPAPLQVSAGLSDVAASTQDPATPPHVAQTDAVRMISLASPAEQAPATPEPAATATRQADDGVAEKPQTPAASVNGPVDINKASVETLNHLPGAGLIGRTIVSHRPYRSVQDLVDRKILRFSAFQRVKSRIRVD